MKNLDFPKPYVPNLLPLSEIVCALMQDKNFLTSVVKSERKLSEFIGYLQNLPNPEILISSLTLQEAVLSSKIEGTIATVSDVINENKSSDVIKNDVIEIDNYCKAVHFGYDELNNEVPAFSKYLIRQLHVLLLSNNVRGFDKTPGSFKIEQNYICNDVLGNFTPLPPFLTDEYMDNLIMYLNKTSEFSELIQAAIIHAQFELIHPFKDGNGRVGRLLIPLFLYFKKILPYPVFFISRYFAENNDIYKSHLTNLSRAVEQCDKVKVWRDWINFFLSGINDEGQRHISSAKAIIDLHKKMSALVNKTEMLMLIDILFKEFKAEPKEVTSRLKLPDTSVRRELQKLADGGYIQRTGSNRKTVYIFTKLIDILQ